MYNPKISVIMSTFNDEKFIAESIESILNQTFKDFEFIVINDCSTDNTLNIIKSYQEKDNRIILINNEKNLWLTKNLNEWLKIAKWKYIARMDADDISLPQRLQIQYDYLENYKDIFLVGSGAKIIDENWNFKYKYNHPNSEKKIIKTLLNNSSFYHPSIFFRNKWYFYRDKFIYTQDYDFYLCLLTTKERIINITDCLIKYRINSNSISFSKMSKQRLFKEKAKELYLQRNKFWKDDYDNFDPNEILNIDIENSINKIVLEWEIISNFNLNNFNYTKIICKKYFKYNWYFNKYIFYYLLSFTNRKIIDIIKKIIF